MGYKCPSDQVSLQTLYTLNDTIAQPTFTPQSQPVVRENSSVNQSTVAVAGSAIQPTANTNPYSQPTGNGCYRYGELGHRSSTCPKRVIVNLVVAKEGEAEGEQECKQVYNDVNPYAYDLNEIQDDEEGMPLGRSLVIQRFLLTPRVDYTD